MEQTRYYETMVIVPTTLGEEQVNALIERARTVPQNLGATVDEARVGSAQTRLRNQTPQRGYLPPLPLS